MPPVDESKGAIGPEGDFVEFPEYDGAEPPKEAKKAFTQFCINTRKEVKTSLDPEERRNKVSYKSLFRNKIVVPKLIPDNCMSFFAGIGQ
jgi:hypothetical protein